MKRLLKYFLKGLLVFVPAALTIFVIIWVFTQLDELLRNIFRLHLPGLGLIITIVIITVIGFLASNFLGRKFFALVDRLFTKLPLVKLLYSSLKDMIEAFAGQKKCFDQPVLVQLVPHGAKVMGFVTTDSLGFLGLTDYVSVYLPQSYNFAGSVLIFPASQVKPLDVESSKAMAFIVSGGVSGK